MQMIVAIVKPNKVEAVRAALVGLGILGMTAMECKGYAQQLGHNERYRGPKLDAGFVPKALLMVCVKDTDAERALAAIAQAAHTGNVGDGKVFVLGVDQAMRIRTGERDDAAL